MNMNEFGITKIMDGIFISDLSLMQDFDFLIGNKVSHIIVWADAENQITLNESSIKVLRFDRHGSEGSLPDSEELLKIYDFVEESREECLCCLLCSDFQSEAGMLLSPYIIKKYHSVDLDFAGILKLFSDLSVQDLLGSAQEFRLLNSFRISSFTYKYPSQRHVIFIFKIELKHIEFTYEFLQAYHTDDFEEKFLLNTIKNTTLDKINCFQEKKTLLKRRKRVQWFDRARPSSSTTSFKCKFTVYNRNSSAKAKIQLPQKQNNKPNFLSLDQSLKSRKQQKKSSKTVNFGEFFMDDLEFESLKQLTRCKIIDSRMKGSLRKSSSFKLMKTENSHKQNKQNEMQKIYNGDPIPFKKGENQSAFRSLKNLSKLKLGLNA